eukprot:gene5595-gene2530
MVSRKHATIFHTDVGWMIVDQSSNGVLVNSCAIPKEKPVLMGYVNCVQPACHILCCLWWHSRRHVYCIEYLQAVPAATLNLFRDGDRVAFGTLETDLVYQFRVGGSRPMAFGRQNAGRGIQDK